MTKNPKWEYSELVLALELYMLHRPNPPGKTSRDVKILSNLQESPSRLLAWIYVRKKVITDITLRINIKCCFSIV